MKKSYVPEAMKHSPFFYRHEIGAGKPRTGWVSADHAHLVERPLGAFLIEDWLPAVELELEPTSFVSQRGHVLKYIVPALGDVPIGNVTREMLREFYAQTLRTRRNGRQLSKSTAIRIHAVLHRVFEALIEANVIMVNPAKGARPRWRKSDRYESLIWTPKELVAFLETIRNDRLFALWHLLAWTGMRRGEVAALRWQDFHLKNSTVAIRRAFALAERRQYLTLPKAAQARVVELDRPTVGVVRAHRRLVNRERRDRRRKAVGDHAYVFTTLNGAPLSLNAISSRFRELVTASGLPKIRMHDLRHTHASHLIEAGASVKAVQERLGHSDVIVTLNLYSHVLPTTQRKAIDKLNRFYG